MFYVKVVSQLFETVCLKQFFETRNRYHSTQRTLHFHVRLISEFSMFCSCFIIFGVRERLSRNQCFFLSFQETSPGKPRLLRVFCELLSEYTPKRIQNSRGIFMFKKTKCKRHLEAPVNCQPSHRRKGSKSDKVKKKTIRSLILLSENCEHDHFRKT